MARLRTRSIVLWTLLLGGFATGSLLASVQSDWVEDQLFGPSPQIADAPEPDASNWILSTFDSGRTVRIEDQCRSDSYFVDYRIGGIFLDTVGEVFVEGNQVRAKGRIASHDARREGTDFVKAPRTLTQDELLSIWLAVESMHPVDPPPRTRRGEPQTAMDGYVVAFAVCEGGQLWTAMAETPASGGPASKASAVLLPYLTPPPHGP